MTRLLLTLFVAIALAQDAAAQSFTTVCVGEYVGNCIQPPMAFFDCNFKYQPGPINPRISLKVCGHAMGKIVRVHTTSGNRCGYTFDHVWCENLVSSLADR
jgi:hypothetical protein